MRRAGETLAQGTSRRPVATRPFSRDKAPLLSLSLCPGPCSSLGHFGMRVVSVSYSPVT